MKVRALRGVCIAPSRHLKAGEVADVDNGTAQFLVSIKAVEHAPEEPKPEPKKSDDPQTKAKEK